MSTILSLRLTPVSDWVTPLQADTIFGHLCWRIKHAGGSVEEFLEAMDPKKEPFGPPFVLSNGLPNGCIPRPRCAWEFAKEDEICRERSKKNMSEAFERVKRFTKESAFIRIENLADFSRVTTLGDMFASGTYGKEKSEETIGLKASVSGEFPSGREVKTTLDRRNNMTLEAQGPYSLPVYSKERRGKNESNIPKDLWLLLKIIDRDRFEALDEKYRVKENIRSVFSEGYGKRKSTGKGVFEVDEWKEESSNAVLTGENGSRVLFLSHFSPAANDPTEGMYEVFVKYGKLSEERSLAGGGNFYKKPLLFIKEGATFMLSKRETPCVSRPYFGRMFCNVCADEAVGSERSGLDSVQQYAYGFPLFF